MSYPDVQPQPSFPAVETGILQFWDADGTFQASIDRRADADEFVFYDGPPFANGLPHYGHLLTGYVKDAVPRYRTMRGRRVERRFGWDCHGLPAEVEAERQLGISGKADIVHRFVAGRAGPSVPATLLQSHPDLQVIIDQDAGARLDTDEARLPVA